MEHHTATGSAWTASAKPFTIYLGTVLFFSVLLGLLIAASPFQALLPDIISRRCLSLYRPSYHWIGVEVLTIVTALIGFLTYQLVRWANNSLQQSHNAKEYLKQLQPVHGEDLNTKSTIHIIDDGQQQRQSEGNMGTYHDDELSDDQHYNQDLHNRTTIDENEVFELDEDGKIKTKKQLQAERDHYADLYENSLEILNSYKTQIDEFDQRLRQETDALQQEYTLANTVIKNKIIHAINAYNLSLSTSILNSVELPVANSSNRGVPSGVRSPVKGGNMLNSTLNDLFSGESRLNTSIFNLSSSSIPHMAGLDRRGQLQSEIITLDQYNLNSSRIDTASISHLSLNDLIELYINATSDKSHRVEAFANLLRVKLAHKGITDLSSVVEENIRGFDSNQQSLQKHSGHDEEEAYDPEGNRHDDTHTNYQDQNATFDQLGDYDPEHITAISPDQNQLQSIQAERDELIAEKTALLSELDTAHTALIEFEQLRDDHTRLDSDYKHLQEEYSRLEKAAQELESECNYLLDMNDELQMKFTTVSELLKASQNQVSQLDDEIAALTQRQIHQQQQQQYSSPRPSHKSRYHDDHDSDSNSIPPSDDESGSDYDDESNQPHHRMTPSSPSYRKQFETQVTQLTEQNHHLKVTLRNQEEKSRAVIDKLHDNIDELQHELDQECHKSSTLAKELNAVTEQLSRVQEKLSHAEHRCQELEILLKQNTALNQSQDIGLSSEATRQQLEDLQSRLEYQTTRAETSHAQAQHLENQLNLARRQVADLTIEKDRLHTTLMQESKVGQQLRRENEVISGRLLNTSFTSGGMNATLGVDSSVLNEFNQSSQNIHHHNRTLEGSLQTPMVGGNPFNTPTYKRNRGSLQQSAALETPFSRLINDDNMMSPATTVSLTNHHNAANASRMQSLSRHQPRDVPSKREYNQDGTPFLPPLPEAQFHAPTMTGADKNRRHTMGEAFYRHASHGSMITPASSSSGDGPAATHRMHHPQRRATTFAGLPQHHSVYNENDHNIENSDPDPVLFSPITHQQNKNAHFGMKTLSQDRQQQRSIPQSVDMKKSIAPPITSTTPQLSYNAHGAQRQTRLPQSLTNKPDGGQPSTRSSVSRTSIGSDHQLHHPQQYTFPATGGNTAGGKPQPQLHSSLTAGRQAQTHQLQAGNVTAAGRSGTSIGNVLSVVDPTRPVAGCVISTVAPNSFAQAVGLEPQDVVLSIASKPTINIQAFESARNSLQKHVSIPIVVRRDSKIHTIYFNIDDSGRVKKDESQTSHLPVKHQNKRHSASSSSSSTVRIATNTVFDYEPYPP